MQSDCGRAESGRDVLWGGASGRHFDVDEGTVLLVQSMPVGINGRPLPYTHGDDRWMLIRHDERLPEDFRQGRFLITLGTFQSRARTRLGDAETEVGLALVNSRDTRLWSDRVYRTYGESYFEQLRHLQGTDRYRLTRSPGRESTLTRMGSYPALQLSLNNGDVQRDTSWTQFLCARSDCSRRSCDASIETNVIE